MTTYRNGFFSKMGKKIIRFLNYNVKKALNIYIPEIFIKKELMLVNP